MTTLNEALETLSLLPDWEQRYTYVIELARTLPPMPAAEKTEDNLVPGCTSRVWLTVGWNNDKTDIHLESDALIVKGLMALVHMAYHHKTREEIAALDLPELLKPTNLMQHLSPNRRNGFVSVVKRLQALAA
ncbi:MAG: SufE family protein [Blastochloris viridis]|uniref:SufE family protein n=1 Tax=Blastochloris viridis TaxID=1079 RepID=A0A6N4R9R3_BLAVI|nr:MAG: SufE family protein [Blastochloris viridis]